MIPAPVFFDACHAHGIRFITGTPCSYLKPLINAAIGDPRFLFRDATNEGDAVALAAGAALAGVCGLVMFQNSGLGNAVNALTSLCDPFRVPVLLVVTHRGEPGGPPDEPQHELMGRITTALLDTLGVAWARFPAEPRAVATVVAAALAHMTATGRPFALVMSKDAVAPYALALVPQAGAPGTREFRFSETLLRTTPERATRTEALQIIRAARPPSGVLIATTGYTSRELYALGDDPWNLYLVGSMGSASAVGLGLALASPAHSVSVIDGDGAALMRLGNFATLGAYAPPTLTHILLDNEANDSTGGQSTVSRGVSFAAIAKACGYKYCVSTDNSVHFAEALSEKVASGPRFIHFKIKAGAPEHLPRPCIVPHNVFYRLNEWLHGLRG